MKKTRGNRIHIIVLLLFTIFLLNYFYPVVRFSSPLSNYIAALIFWLSPVYLFYNSSFLSNDILKVISAFVFILLSFLSLAVIFFIIIDIITVTKDGKDYSFENIHTLNGNGYDIKIYRTNGGATTDYGIKIRQEKKLFSGLVLVKELFSKYHCDDARCRMLQKNILEVEDCETGMPQEILVMDMVYF